MLQINLILSFLQFRFQDHIMVWSVHYMQGSSVVLVQNLWSSIHLMLLLFLRLAKIHGSYLHILLLFLLDIQEYMLLYFLISDYNLHLTFHNMHLLFHLRGYHHFPQLLPQTSLVHQSVLQEVFLRFLVQSFQDKQLMHHILLF